MIYMSEDIDIKSDPIFFWRRHKKSWSSKCSWPLKMKWGYEYHVWDLIKILKGTKTLGDALKGMRKDLKWCLYLKASLGKKKSIITRPSYPFQ